MKLLTNERASELRAQGITQVASVLHSEWYHEWFGVATLDEILDNGGKRPRKYWMVDRWGDPIEAGFTRKEIDWSITIRWCDL